MRHFKWNEDGFHVVGKTAIGRATVMALKLNNEIMVMVRRAWLAVEWHPRKSKCYGYRGELAHLVA